MWKLRSGMSVGKDVGAKSVNEELRMDHGSRCLGSVFHFGFGQLLSS
jgi:hypothetical protein